MLAIFICFMERFLILKSISSKEDTLKTIDPVSPLSLNRENLPSISIACRISVVFSTSSQVIDFLLIHSDNVCFWKSMQHTFFDFSLNISYFSLIVWMVSFEVAPQTPVKKLTSNRLLNYDKPCLKPSLPTKLSNLRIWKAAFRKN